MYLIWTWFFEIFRKWNSHKSLLFLNFCFVAIVCKAIMIWMKFPEKSSHFRNFSWICWKWKCQNHAEGEPSAERCEALSHFFFTWDYWIFISSKFMENCENEIIFSGNFIQLMICLQKTIAANQEFKNNNDLWIYQSLNFIFWKFRKNMSIRHKKNNFSISEWIQWGISN